ncbi:MAG: hypothetical protein WBR29_05355 [Gammaproteobacteria bacterium]
MKYLKTVLSIVLLIAGLTATAQETQLGANSKANAAQKLTPVEEAVTLAIVDEIYAHHLQGFVADVGKQQSASVYELNAYFKPALNSKKVGWVVYKLMPYGQVLRMFTLRQDGVAVLYGKLRDRFPPTQPSYLTVYMDDDELCRFETNALKVHFDVSLKPSAERVAQAVARQKERTSP